MQPDYIQEQPKASYNFNLAMLMMRRETLEEVKAENIQYQARNEKAGVKQAQEYGEKYGNAAYAAWKRDQAKSTAELYHGRGHMTATITGASYAAIVGSLTALATHPDSYTKTSWWVGTLGVFACNVFYNLSHKNKNSHYIEEKPNFLFQRSREFFKEAKNYRRTAKENDQVVFALNGGDINQCTFKKETLEWAENYRVLAEGEERKTKKSKRSRSWNPFHLGFSAD